MNRTLVTLVALSTLTTLPPAFAEFRSAKEMQKECRVALDVLQGKADKNFQNSLFTGECIGYIQGTADTALALAENVTWYKVCIPDNVSTLALIQKFIIFVDNHPQYELASTAIQLMLADEYPCPKKKSSLPSDSLLDGSVFRLVGTEDHAEFPNSRRTASILGLRAGRSSSTISQISYRSRPR